MRKKHLGIGGAIAAIALVVTMSSPAAAVTASGYQSCSSSQGYGIQTRLNAGWTTTTVTLHTYTSADSRPFYGGGYKNSTRGNNASAGSWSAYTPHTSDTARGTCGPKIT
ncbi:hypothetical protein BKA10_001362 [Microbacterium invictum]|uniref:Lactococcin 972 family bacteriocin n=1 Tax=Microbacterium invictum TaxID=515415 RepID=A0AA40SNR0_9MICO|nr:hypothetical protein [Microbacterium invictum]